MSSRRLAVSIGYLTGTRLVFNTAWRFVYPFLPAISRGLGVSLERAGLLVSARSIAGMATPLVVATVGRGERRRRIVTVTLALFVVGASVTAATGAFTGALVGFVLIGLAKPSFDVAAHAYIADRVPYRRRARALSILELTWAGGLLVGAPVTGWMIDRLDWRAPFWAFAALGIVAVLLLRPALDPDTGGDGTAAEPFRLTRPAAALLASVFFFNLGAETTIVVFGAWLEEGFGISLVALGGLTMLLALGELLGEGTTLAFTDRVGKRRMVAMGLVVSALAFGAVGFLADSMGGGLSALGIAFFAYEVTIVSAIPLTTELMPGARARLLALFQLAGQAARALGAAIGPAVFSAGGIGANGALSAGLEIVSLIILLRWVSDHEVPTRAV
ncbi:MAG TPA: MFS transporter [Acidimicrobiia bacterium]|nr:MFS transporter [Acidimicrobiia bacterium]